VAVLQDAIGMYLCSVTTMKKKQLHIRAVGIDKVKEAGMAAYHLLSL